MLTKLLHRLYGIVIIGCILLCPVLSGCDDDTVNGFLQFSDDNLLLRAPGILSSLTSPPVPAGKPRVWPIGVLWKKSRERPKKS